MNNPSLQDIVDGVKETIELRLISMGEKLRQEFSIAANTMIKKQIQNAMKNLTVNIYEQLPDNRVIIQFSFEKPKDEEAITNP